MKDCESCGKPESSQRRQRIKIRRECQCCAESSEEVITETVYLCDGCFEVASRLGFAGWPSDGVRRL